MMMIDTTVIMIMTMIMIIIVIIMATNSPLYGKVKGKKMKFFCLLKQLFLHYAVLKIFMIVNI